MTPEFGRTVGWKITEGRDFSRAYADSNSIILSEATVKTIGIPHPVGEIVKFFGKNRTVIGVVQDMVTNSPYEPIEPAIFLGDGYLSVITVRMKAGLPLPIAMTAIEKVFKKYNPGSPFVYQYNDDDYAKKFATEERVANLSAVFAGMAIFISCLGMFGLASFVAEQRTKEIGVRKVLGATMFSLWKMLSTQFVRLGIDLALYFHSPVLLWNEPLAAGLYLSRKHFLVDFCGCGFQHFADHAAYGQLSVDKSSTHESG